MLAIVTTASSAHQNTVPETLAMDVHRLQVMQIEFNFLTMATATIAVVISEVRPPLPVIRNVSEILLEAINMEVAVERVTELHIAEPLRATTRASIVRSAEPTSAVRKLMITRIRKALRAMVLTGNAPGDIRPEVRLLLPRIETMAHKLLALCKLNRTVHLPTYNKLIGEAARKMR